MSRTGNLNIFKDEKNKRYYESSMIPNIEPNINDIYVITTPGDRYDLLSYKYYGDAQYWWVIAHANSEFNGSLVIPSGVQIRIPYDYQSVIASINNLNQL